MAASALWVPKMASPRLASSKMAAPFPFPSCVALRSRPSAPLLSCPAPKKGVTAMAAAGHGRTVLVRGLPPAATAAQLESLFGHLGPLRRCFVVTEKGTPKCRGFGYVTFSLAEDAERCLRTPPALNGCSLPVMLARQRLRVEGAQPRGDCKAPTAPPKTKKSRGGSKKARLIVRNLSFQCSETELQSLFSPFGSVLEVNIPKKPDGKMRGFAFVQMKNIPEAAQALKRLNLTPIKGRPVAVDWAVAKDKFRATQEGGSKGGENRHKEEEKKKEEEEEEKGEEEEDEETLKKIKGKMKVKMGTKTKASSSQARGRAGKGTAGMTSREEEDEEEEQEEEEGAAEEGDSGEEEEEMEEEDEEEKDGDEDEEEEDEEEEGGGELEKQHRKGGQRPSDVREGRTLFIRNLSFDTEEAALAAALGRFGTLSYVRVVLHPDTEHSKGCAFAQFCTREAAQECLRTAQDGEGEGLRVDGRRLRVDAAVTREEAKQLRGKGTMRAGGTRNLYLAREGLIRAGTKAAEGVSDADMAKRARFEELKHQKLRDPNIFVSRTRLCVHNLPKAVDSARLRQLLRSLPTGGGPLHIKECRVMREHRGQGPSLGFAFVELGTHAEALTALRALNNNPQLFGAHKRPIVEFSLEDRRKLRLKEQRTQHSLLKLKPKLPEPLTVGSPPAPPNQPRGRQPPNSPEATVSPPGAVWSGFRAAQPERVELLDGTTRQRVLPLPSHRGPKIRKRDKGKVKPPPQKKQPKSKARQRRKEQHGAAPPQVRRGGPRGAEARFTELVERYKRRILGGSEDLPAKRSKWFES